MGETLLTYIIPLFNTEAFVLRCLQSVVNQGLRDYEYEVIVVDDGSTDGSRGIVEDFCREHPNVHLLCQDNAGVSAARNLALDQARGRYVQFVDSDDSLDAYMMAPLLKRAVDSDLDVLVFNYYSVDVNGKVLPLSRDDNHPSTGILSGVDYLDSHTMTPYVWRFLVRRDYLNQGNWRFDTSLIVCEDGALIAQFLLNAPRVAHDISSPYCYVNRSDSAMHNPDSDHLHRRIISQVDAAASIDNTAKRFEVSAGRKAPASVTGVRNVYLYFSMTKALMCGYVNETLARIRQYGLYPFPCVGTEANYFGIKWRLIHRLMMCPGLWKFLSRVYCMIRK